MAAEEEEVPVLDGDAPAGGDDQPAREKKSKSKSKTAEEYVAFCPCQLQLHRFAARGLLNHAIHAAEHGSASQVVRRSSARRPTLVRQIPSLITYVTSASGRAPTPDAVGGATTTSA